MGCWVIPSRHCCCPSSVFSTQRTVWGREAWVSVLAMYNRCEMVAGVSTIWVLLHAAWMSDPPRHAMVLDLSRATDGCNRGGLARWGQKPKTWLLLVGIQLQTTDPSLWSDMLLVLSPLLNNYLLFERRERYPASRFHVGNMKPDAVSTVITTQLEAPKALALYTNRVH